MFRRGFNASKLVEKLHAALRADAEARTANLMPSVTTMHLNGSEISVLTVCPLVGFGYFAVTPTPVDWQICAIDRYKHISGQYRLRFLGQPVPPGFVSLSGTDFGRIDVANARASLYRYMSEAIADVNAEHSRVYFRLSGGVV